MTEQTEREALEALFADLHGTKDSIPLHRYTIKWRDRRDRFTTMLDAGAYLDAALMLVPEGLVWAVAIQDDGMAMAGVRGSSLISESGGITEAATPALALCAAIKSALSTGGEDDDS